MSKNKKPAPRSFLEKLASALDPNTVPEKVPNPDVFFANRHEIIGATPARIANLRALFYEIDNSITMRLRGAQAPYNQSSYNHFSKQLSENDERDVVFRLLDIAIHELLIDSFDRFHGCFVFLADGQVAGVLPPKRLDAEPTYGQRPTTQRNFHHSGVFCATAP